MSIIKNKPLEIIFGILAETWKINESNLILHLLYKGDSRQREAKHDVELFGFFGTRIQHERQARRQRRATHNPHHAT